MTPRYRSATRTARLLLLLWGLCACDDAQQQAKPQVRIATWWRTNSETAAKDYLLDTMQAEHDVHFEDITPVDKIQRQRWVRETFTSREELPPHSFLVNLGKELTEWAQPNRRMLTPLPSGVIDWSRFHPKLAGDMAETEPFAVPVNVHQENLIFINEDLFLAADLNRYIDAEYDLSQRQGMEQYFAAFGVDQLLELCVGFRRALDDPEPPPELSGVAQSLSLVREDWALALVGLENLLLSRSGAREFQALFSASGADESALYAMAEDLARLMQCGGDAKESWEEAVGRFSEGQALMTIMGDWARGEIWSDSGVGADGEFGESSSEGGLPFRWRMHSMIGPDSEAVFVYTADIFPMVRGLDAQPEVREMLRFMAEPETQIEFARRKGGIPAVQLSDQEKERLRDDPGSSQQDTLDAFEESTTVLAISGRAGPSIEPLIDRAFLDFYDQIAADPPALFDSDWAMLQFEPSSDWRFELLVNRLHAYGQYGG